MKVAYERFEGSNQFFADKAPVIGIFLDMNKFCILPYPKKRDQFPYIKIHTWLWDLAE